MKRTLLTALLGATLFSSVASAETLTEVQKDDLTYIYQEEKVARDVYRVLGNVWGENVFINIQESEQQHMDAVKGLLVQYSLPIPVIEDTTGVFENEELQSLYNELVAEGKKSKEAAYKVGILIEETDITDLEERMEDAPDDVVRVFSNLLSGSESHFRAFSRALSSATSSNTNGNKR